MELHQIEDRDELERALSAPRFLLFKHSQICPVSHRAFGQYRAFMQGNDELPSAWLDVIAQRPLSQHAAAETGVEHASPQAILLEDGRPAWDASHGAITCEALTALLNTPHPPTDER